MSSFFRFCWETGKFAVAGGGVAGWIAKSVLLVVLVVFGITDKSRPGLSVIVPADEAAPSREVNLNLPSIGWIVTGAAVVLLIVFSAGVTWVRITNLKIEGVQSSNGHRRIVVRNRSGKNVRFSAFLESITPVPAREYPYNGANFQIDGTEPPHREGEIPPHQTRCVNICFLKDWKLWMLFARYPSEPVEIPAIEYTVRIGVHPVAPDSGKTEFGVFRIIPDEIVNDSVDLIPIAKVGSPLKKWTFCAKAWRRVRCLIFDLRSGRRSHRSSKARQARTPRIANDQPASQLPEQPPRPLPRQPFP